MSLNVSSTLAVLIALLPVTNLARADVVIEGSAFGTTVEVVLGDTVIVKPPIDVARWQVDYSGDVLEMQTPPERVSSPGPDGWRFKAAAQGQTDIALVDATPAGPGGAPPAPRRFTVTIDVKSQRSVAGQVVVVDARLSPDGRTVAYTRARALANGRTEAMGLSLISFAGGAARELVIDQLVPAFEWSIDSRRLIYLTGLSPRRIEIIEFGGDTPSRSGFPELITRPAVVPPAPGSAERALFTEAVGKDQRSLLIGNGRETWIDLVTRSTGVQVTVMPPGIATIAVPPSWNADATHFVVVGSTTEHGPEVFAGSLPLTISSHPDFVGAAPPQVRRLTFSNP